MKPEIIQQGAEAVLIKRGELVLKRREKKGYRLQELDEKIRKLRTRGEARLLEKAGKVVPVPKVLKVDEKSKEIDMYFVEGKKLSECLDELKNWKEVCVKIGKNIALLHDADIIHGDLTTSNMIWQEEKSDSSSLNYKARRNLVNSLRSLRQPTRLKLSQKSMNGGDKDNVGLDDNYLRGGGKIVFIDFGLGFQNGHVEDKAVDLHVLKEALEARHFAKWEKYFAAVLEGYKVSKKWKEVLKRLEAVEKRGRYKQNY